LIPVFPAVIMRGFMTQPSPLTVPLPVRLPSVPARGIQEQEPLQVAKSRAS